MACPLQRECGLVGQVSLFQTACASWSRIAPWRNCSLATGVNAILPRISFLLSWGHVARLVESSASASCSVDVRRRFSMRKGSLRLTQSAWLEEPPSTSHCQVPLWPAPELVAIWPDLRPFTLLTPIAPLVLTWLSSF